MYLFIYPLNFTNELSSKKFYNKNKFNLFIASFLYIYPYGKLYIKKKINNQHNNIDFKKKKLICPY